MVLLAPTLAWATAPHGYVYVRQGQACVQSLGDTLHQITEVYTQVRRPAA